jgi:hypothetical protein
MKENKGKTTETDPNRSEISASAAATNLGITAQALGQWAKRSGAPVRVEGRRVYVQWPAFARWREEALIAEATKALREQLADKANNPRGTARERLDQASARTAEINLELLEGSVIRVEEAEGVVEKLCSSLRAVLIPFPRRWAPELITATTVLEMETRLDKAIAKTMEGLAGATDWSRSESEPEQERAA